MNFKIDLGLCLGSRPYRIWISNFLNASYMQINIIFDSMNASYEKDGDISNNSKQWKYAKKSTNASNTIKRKWNSFLDYQMLVMQNNVLVLMQRKECKICFFFKFYLELMLRFQGLLECDLEFLMHKYMQKKVIPIQWMLTKRGIRVYNKVAINQIQENFP